LSRVPPVRPQPPDGEKRRHELEALEPGELARAAAGTLTLLKERVVTRGSSQATGMAQTTE